MQFAVFLPADYSPMWALARQMGVDRAVTTLPRAEAGAQPWDFYPMLHLKQRFADAGLEVAVIESAPPMERIRLGLPGRDEEIEWFCTLLRSMGAVGIPVLCYNYMAVFNWQRTSITTPTRGSARASSYDH